MTRHYTKLKARTYSGASSYTTESARRDFNSTPGDDFGRVKVTQ